MSTDHSDLAPAFPPSPEPSHSYPVHLCPLWEVAPYVLCSIEQKVRRSLAIPKGQQVSREDLAKYEEKQRLAREAGEAPDTDEPMEDAERPSSPTYSPRGACSPTYSPRGHTAHTTHTTHTAHTPPTPASPASPRTPPTPPKYYP